MKKQPKPPVRTSHPLREELPEWGVLLLESHHASDFKMEPRTHRFLKIIYVLSGSGVVEIDHREHRFAPRDVIVVPAQRRNRIKDDPGSTPSLYIFCLSTELLCFDASVHQRLQPGCLRRSNQFAHQVERRLRRLLYRQEIRNDLTPLRIFTDAIQLLEIVLSQPLAADHCEQPQEIDEVQEIRAYIEYLRTHFFEATTIEAAARRVGIERRRFTQLFRDQTGTTWLKYVRQLSIDHAVQLLECSTLPITSIAFECGFEDLSTFYRRFKSATGMSPGAWRERHAGDGK